MRTIYTDDSLLKIENICKYFPVRRMSFIKSHSHIRAVDNISFSIKKGETLGLVGESGCGKSTTGRVILRLHEPTSGHIYFEGKNITQERMNPYRKKMQIIFQDPYASLDPRMVVREIVGEPLDIHSLANAKEREERIDTLLEMVGLNREQANRYPHELSGGQRQRVGIARALSVEPRFIVCDEPTSALDISMQLKIIDMLEDFQQRFDLAYLFISHNLAVVKHISHRVAVMYLGRIIEVADTRELYSNPQHPYTKALLSAAAFVAPGKTKKKEKLLLEGDVPNLFELPSGCRFRTRCRYALKKCEEVEPELKNSGNGHMCSCHLFGYAGMSLPVEI